MGYSCTKDASDILGLIRHAFNDGTGNGIKSGAFHGFYEIGRENADGAITGTVFENVGEGFARRVGSFRIEPDGFITRFPSIKRNQRVQLKFRFDELRRTNPQLLSSYSYGVI